MPVQREYQGVQVNIGHSASTGQARYGTIQSDGRSQLVKAQEAEGANANFCPFGCQDEELDEQGYCYHLIGFSPDGRKLERNVLCEDGRIRTRAPIKKIGGRFKIVHDEVVDRTKHTLVSIVNRGSCRVYENIPRPSDYPEMVSDELSDDEIEAIDAEEGDDPEPVVPEPSLDGEPRRSHKKKVKE